MRFTILSISGFVALLALAAPTNADISWPHKPDELIVKFKNPPSNLPAILSPQDFKAMSKNIDKLLRQYGAIEVKQLYPAIAKPTLQARSVTGEIVAVPDLYGTALVKFSSGTNLEQALSIFSASPEVEYAAFNYLRKLSAVPNDTNFAWLWGLKNTGQSGSLSPSDPATGTAGADIDAALAWDTTKGTSSVVVAVIDGGFYYDHEDLKDNIWANSREISSNGIDDDGNGYKDDVRGWDFGDNDNNPAESPSGLAVGHGTFVAGVVGAVGNNGKGITGLAWNTKIMTLKGADVLAFGILDSASYSAVLYAADNGAKIINMSFTGPTAVALEQAIDYASSRGLLLVAAAGNDGVSIATNSYPAAFEKVIAAAATNRNDQKADFSNYGVWVDISAPGVGMCSTTYQGGYACNEGDGTSFASPLVAGAAGLIWSAYPDLTALQVRGRLLNSCESIDSLNPNYIGQLGCGRLNAAKALAPDVPPGLLAYALGTASATWTWSVSAGSLTYNVYRSSSNVSIGSVTTTAVSLTQLSTNTAYAVRIAGVNLSAESSLSVSATVYTLAAPAMGLTINEVAISSVSFSWQANTNPAYTLYKLTAASSDRTISTETLSLTHTLTSLSGGTAYSFYVQAKNGDGLLTAPSVALTTATKPAAPASYVTAPETGATLTFSPPSGEVKVEVPPNGFLEVVTITVQNPSSIPAPVNPAMNLGATNVAVEVTLDKAITPNKEVSITMAYRDSDVAGLNENNLVIARYDATKSIWVTLPSTPDPINNKVTATTKGFSTFEVMEIRPKQALDSVKIFPNPFILSRGHSQITFSNLVADSTIAIYSLAGEKLREISANSAGLAYWDGRNAAGRVAASGVYFALITTPSDKKVAKLAIER